MSAVSAIGLQLCPMATNEKCSNDSDITTNALALSATPAYQNSPEMNVYVTIINNITINLDKEKNIDTKSVNKLTSNSTTLLISKDFLRSLIVNDNSEEKLPNNDFLKANSNYNNSVRNDEYVDPCSHPEYIVFTWVSRALASYF